MNLHLDNSAFETLILGQAERTGLRRDVLEKDYYVSLILEELAFKQKTNHLPAYFKGGTALYKALKCIRRFSEDIDITVYVEDCPSNSQKQKRLEEAVEKYHSLIWNKEDPGNDNKKGSITTIYNYDSVVDVDFDDELQRFGKVKIEATSFTISEPHTQLEIAPLLYENATLEQQETLRSQYQVSPFEVETIRLERIFIDKVFAAEYYFQRGKLRDTSKHLYDIVVMLGLEEVKQLFQNSSDLDHLVEIKRQEEKARFGSKLSEISISSFSYIRDFSLAARNLSEFQAMQNLYVLDDQFRQSTDTLQHGMQHLEASFKGR